MAPRVPPRSGASRPHPAERRTPRARTALALVWLGVVTAAALLVPAPARAAVPNRLYGTVTLNGAPAPIGTEIVAFTGGKRCGSTRVTALQQSGTSYPYILDVPGGDAAPECLPGAVITFTVGGVPAGQTFVLDDVASFNRIDLVAPGTPNVPGGAPRSMELAAGCTEVTATFPGGATAAVVAAAVTPPGALSAIWWWDAAARLYRGYGPAAPWASDLTAINPGDRLRICTTAAATLTMPA
jgi:hypothetical protein